MSGTGLVTGDGESLLFQFPRGLAGGRGIPAQAAAGLTYARENYRYFSVVELRFLSAVQVTAAAMPNNIYIVVAPLGRDQLVQPWGQIIPANATTPVKLQGAEIATFASTDSSMDGWQFNHFPYGFAVGISRGQNPNSPLFQLQFSAVLGKIQSVLEQ